MRPPSSGSTGIRFSSANMMFTFMPASATESQNGPTSPVGSMLPASTRATTAQMASCNRFEPGPAKATQNMPARCGLRFEKFTGTGLAQPNMKGLNASVTIGTSTVPSGSMCFTGFSVTRPSIHAVESPKRLATKPWAASCSVIAKITGIA
jgi:hypothetical protein